MYKMLYKNMDKAIYYIIIVCCFYGNSVASAQYCKRSAEISARRSVVHHHNSMSNRANATVTGNERVVSGVKQAIERYSHNKSNGKYAQTGTMLRSLRGRAGDSVNMLRRLVWGIGSFKDNMIRRLVSGVAGALVGGVVVNRVYNASPDIPKKESEKESPEPPNVIKKENDLRNGDGDAERDGDAKHEGDQEPGQDGNDGANNIPEPTPGLVHVGNGGNGLVICGGAHNGDGAADGVGGGDEGNGGGGADSNNANQSPKAGENNADEEEKDRRSELNFMLDPNLLKLDEHGESINAPVGVDDCLRGLLGYPICYEVTDASTLSGRSRIPVLESEQLDGNVQEGYINIEVNSEEKKRFEKKNDKKNKSFFRPLDEPGWPQWCWGVALLTRKEREEEREKLGVQGSKSKKAGK